MKSFSDRKLRQVLTCVWPVCACLRYGMGALGGERAASVLL
eukprot:COSAG04_NODE_19639_length_411_cov_0.993590_2_plen_40_part_01